MTRRGVDDAAGGSVTPRCGWMRLPGGLLVGLVAGLPVLAGCPQQPDTLETEERSLPVNEPVVLRLAYAGSAVWADVESAYETRCASWPVGSPARRTPTAPHVSDVPTPRKVDRGGRSSYSLGLLAQSRGRVVVSCTGPPGARLHVTLTQPPD